jgi:DNA-binding MarR family transcriptional regulator
MDNFETRASERVAELGTNISLAAFAASFNLFRFSTRLIQDLEASIHRPRGLSTAGFRVMFTIWALGEMEPRQLANHSGVSRAAISGAVATLAAAGLVEKSREQADRRLVTVRLSPEGAALLEETYRAQNVHEQGLFSDISAEDLSGFTRVLRSLLDSRAGEAEQETS